MFFWMLALAVGVFFVPSVLAEENGTASTEIVLDRGLEEYAIDQAMERVIQEYTIDAYLAAAKKDPSLCKSEDCKQTMKYLLINRYFAEKRCDQCPEEAFRQACLAVKDNNCKALKEAGWQEVCRVLLGNNEREVLVVFKALEKYQPTTEFSDVIRALGVIAAYRSGGRQTCQRFFDAYPNDVSAEVRFAECRILFADDPLKEYEYVKKELAIFMLARTEKEYCQKLTNPGLIGSCPKPWDAY